MNIVFFGTPDFAVASLNALVEKGYNVVAVVTASDKMGGRGGKQLLESPVKKYAVEHHIPVLQPTNLKSEDFVNSLRAFQADLQIVVAFRMLPEVVWNMPRLGTFNLHGSLLPKYRGAAPINWAIINGEAETGVTTFKLKHAIDTGDVALQAKMHITEEDDAGTVHDNMMALGADLIVKTVEMLENNTLKFIPQRDVESSPAPKLFHQNTQINFDKPVREVYNFIRGLSPYPAAWTIFDDVEMKITKTKILMEEKTLAQPGTIDLSKKYFHIACADGWLDILELKQEGKRQMTVRDFLNGRQH